MASAAAVLVACATSNLLSFTAPATARPQYARHHSRSAGLRFESVERQALIQPESEAVPTVRKGWFGRLRKWGTVAAATAVAYSLPAIAAARTAKKFVSRADEKKASYITVGVLLLFFFGAYVNSKKEDSSETDRIKNEVQRLVRLKKEFEEAEAVEGADDDSMAAALRKASESINKEKDGEGAEGETKEGEEAAGEGEAAKEGDADGDGPKTEGDKDADKPEKPEKPEKPDKPSDDSDGKGKKK